MEWPDNIPSPFRFNCLKHHAGCIKQFIIHKRSNPVSQEVYLSLTRVGSSVSDLYFGEMSVAEILESVSGRLVKESAFKYDDFKDWIASSGEGFRYFTLADSSRWIIKLLKGESYIHIFPARGSDHTVRVKGNSLKTAMWLSIEGYKSLPSLEILNRARKNLNLSPVRRGESSAIESVMFLLTE